MNNVRNDESLIRMVNENLKIGMCVKNYKEMCNLLNEPILTNKTYQLEDWKRCFDYEKQGNKFIIKEIYSIPKEKVDKRMEANKDGKNLKYINEISDILINYIYKNQGADNKVLLSFSKLIGILGLVNNTYTIGNCRKKELSDILNISLQAVNFFYKESRNEFRRIIKSALNNLDNRRIVITTEQYMICEKDKSKNNKNGEYKKYRLAEDEEIGLILDAENLALNELGIENMGRLTLYGISKYKEFIKIVMKELPKDWIFYYKTYELKFGEKAVAREYNKIHDRKLQLNKKGIDKLDKKFIITSEEDNEKKLIDVLIDLTKYDLNLDEQIIELYEFNKAQAFKKIDEKRKESILLKDAGEHMINESNVLLNEADNLLEAYNNRNEIDDHEYKLYSKQILDKKVAKEFVEETGIELPDFYELFK